jgi:hypothetical protein
MPATARTTAGWRAVAQQGGDRTEEGEMALECVGLCSSGRDRRGSCAWMGPWYVDPVAAVMKTVMNLQAP